MSIRTETQEELNARMEQQRNEVLIPLRTAHIYWILIRICKKLDIDIKDIIGDY